VTDRNGLGEKVRAIRESRSMSIEQLADRADLDAGHVGQIESGALIPSLSPLIRIARALGVRLGTFLDDQEEMGPVITRVGAHEAVVRFSGREKSNHSDLDFFSLAANKTGRHMEPFLIDIHPASAKEAQESTHEGEEFIFVLSGDVEIEYGKDTYLLHPGDSIYYDSIVPHHVHSAGDKEAKVIGVVYAP
jgi:transcriptional regulator with XRE-family HTH domain